MEENDIQQADSSQIVPLSSPKSFQSSIEYKLIESTDEDDRNNLQKTQRASFEASMQQDLPMSLIMTENKSNLQQISVEQKVPIGDSVSLSPNVDSSELPSANEVPDDFPSSSDEAYESKEAQDDSITMQSSEVNVCAASQSLLGLREGVQDDASCTDSDKVACETPPAILKGVREDKPQVVHRLKKRQMSIGDTRQKVPTPVSRSISGMYLRTDKTIVDTMTHIESVKVAASKFGGSINWKTRRTQLAQESGHIVLELDKLKNKISECKHQAEAVEAAKLSVLNELERTSKLIEELKHVLEKQQAEEVDAKEDLELFQFSLEEMEGVASDDSVVVKEKLKIIRERHEALVAKLMLVKDESRKVQEDYGSLLIEGGISIRKAQEAFTLSKEAERQVEDLSVELKQLKGALHLAHASCHDAEERKKGTSMARDEDCFIWEKDLRQAEEELDQFDKKLSSIEELESKLDASSSLLLNLKNELVTYMEANLIEEAREQESGTHKSMQEEDILSRNELEEHRRSIAEVRDELCALEVTAASLKSELNIEKAALATMQQKETMASITVSSLKLEIKLSLKELEAVQAKEECQDRMVELPKVLQDAVQEADKAKSIATKAQEKLRKTKEEVEQAKAALSTMELRLQAVQREIETEKESERLALDALRALEDTKVAVNIEQQCSPRMIMLDLDKYASLIEKSHRAEELVQERTAAAIAQVEAAKASESRTLSRLNQIFKALEERKHALLAATEQSDRATEGKLAMEQELRKWREENGKRRKACETSKSGAETAEIIIGHNGDRKGTSKEDGFASVHPLPDVSGRSSPNDLALHAKMDKAKKLSFFPRIIMFLGRRRLKAAK
ncbi:protein WEAK CHLOROPLAST MOVEMENT UNDER BLUE LIGHT 1-like isoform X2 [Phragmites australis]|nr:protein WEAK CHLOROPLAST MOVEMENT UNDER BLUE LIGHT 1-like isoform X2 [Phragmites australis]XP_062216618.1 protein WEAK CHLOROPLAST MOVEMENT UNDER BLUE LIGHT 1-like isoform X2 [Phragmites australis]XP_062216619.1 protein WEAK CHLOROPLAST MOVEMENT UNDER BLUE LIGHT 1-like isoform X2 [Phragmites australis]